MGRGKEKKSGGCFAVIGKITCLIVGVVVLAGIFGGNDSASTPAQNETTITATQDSADASATFDNATAKTPKPTNTPKPTKTPKPTNTPKPTATPEPTTLQGWAESIANDVYGDHGLGEKYNYFISATCMEVDGENAPMVTLDVKYPSSTVGNDYRMGNFLSNARKANAKFAERAKEGKLEYGSLRIVGHTTYIDKYGNESDGMAAEIRVKASEAAKVNWDNFTSDMLPDIAVAFGIHPIIRDGLSLEYLAEIRN